MPPPEQICKRLKPEAQGEVHPEAELERLGRTWQDRQTLYLPKQEGANLYVNAFALLRSLFLRSF